jgi:hypothetical protein
MKSQKNSISLERAKERFHEYYDNKHSDPLSRKRAKMFDAMYQKKKSNTLQPDMPGSNKYLLKHGPKTFDMMGVDWFPEGDIININDDIKVRSRGYTGRREIDSDGQSVYGPRINENDMLYSEYFRKKYYEREDLQDKNLVDYHWKKDESGSKDDDSDEDGSDPVGAEKGRVLNIPGLFDSYESSDDDNEKQEDSIEEVEQEEVNQPDSIEEADQEDSIEEEADQEEADQEEADQEEADQEEADSIEDQKDSIEEAGQEEAGQEEAGQEDSPHNNQSGGGILDYEYDRVNNTPNLYWNMMNKSKEILEDKIETNRYKKIILDNTTFMYNKDTLDVYDSKHRLITNLENYI